MGQALMNGRGTPQRYGAILAMLDHLSVRLRVRFKNPSLSGLQGSIDGVQSGTLRGWAYGDDGQALTLIVKKNGAYLGECQANAPRADLAALGMGDGRYGFSLPVSRDFAVELGDVLEVIDAAGPSRKMALKMTRRVVARPGWKGPFANRADHHKSNGRSIDSSKSGGSFMQPSAALSGCDAAALTATDVEALAGRYAALAAENRQLRVQVAEYETELQLNLLQLRQVQEELETWFLKCQELQGRQESSARLNDVHALPSGARSQTQAGGGRS